MESHLEIRNVHKTFSTARGSIEVLRDISLSVARGEFVCLIGPSGCGKTTLLNLIAGLEKPNGGAIHVNGNIQNGTIRNVGYVFQEFALIPWRNVIDNVSYGLELRGSDKKERKQIAHQLIEIVGLQEFENAYPHQLSGGMKQRVGMARALAVNPAILLMDEPFAALDVDTRRKLQEELLKIWRLTHKTVMFVTHNVSEACSLASKVVVLSGRPATIRKVFEFSAREKSDLPDTERHIMDLLEVNDRQSSNREPRCRSSDEDPTDG